MKNIQQRINDVAMSLEAKGQVFTRSELAFQLQNEGVEDNFELEREVYLAQKNYGFSKTLFKTNDKKHTLVDAYQMHFVLDNQEIVAIEELSNEHSKNVVNSLERAEQALNICISKEAIETAGEVMSLVTGTKGVKQIQIQAKQLNNKYTQMVKMYREAKDCVSVSIDDFIAVRGDVQKQFLSYASALTDIFGDNIKIVAPNMFDFKQIEWLDVSGMYKQIALDYDTISTKCKELCAIISDSFFNTLQQSTQTFKASGDKRVGLALAGLKMVGHYMNTSSRTTSLKGDFARFEKSVAHDKAQIYGDLMRLTTIYKALNDVLMPKATAFLKYSNDLLNGGFQEIMDTIYTSPKAQEMRQKREQLLLDIRKLDRLVQDEEAHINYYTANIKDSTESLQNMRSQYQNAKQTMPQKPFFLFNWITLGSLGRSYRREMFEWNNSCMPVVNSYEDLEIDVNLDKEDLAKYKESNRAHKKEYEKQRMLLNKINSELLTLVDADEATKRALLRSLKDILRLMALAKEITQSKIDDSLIQVAKINKFEDIQLPAEINKGLETFFGTLHDNMHISKKDAANIIDKLGATEVAPHNDNKDYSDEDLQETVVASEELLHKGIDVCQQMIELQKQRIDTESAKAHYEKELLRLRKQFHTQYAELEKQSDYILGIMAELNVANSSNEIKTALNKLSDGELIIPSDEELQEFIKGNRQIVL